MNIRKTEVILFLSKSAKRGKSVPRVATVVIRGAEDKENIGVK